MTTPTIGSTVTWTETDHRGRSNVIVGTVRGIDTFGRIEVEVEDDHRPYVINPDWVTLIDGSA